MRHVRTIKCMWRAALVGLLVTSAVACAKKADDGAAAVAGAPAGTVIAIAGKVTAGTRTLAKGDAIAADDVVETADGARVTIELLHNHAQWSLTGNKRGTARDAKAWKLARVEGSAASVTDTATSAGRDGERSAADTDITTTTTTTAKPSASADSPMNRPATAPDTAGPAREAKSPPRPPDIGRAATPTSPTVAAPRSQTTPKADPTPPPPPPPPGGPAHTRAPTAPPPAPDLKPPPKNDDSKEDMLVMSPGDHAMQILTSDAGIQKCVTAKAHVVITCTTTGCALTSSDANADAKCLKERLGKLALPKAVYTIAFDLTAPAH